jgi:hypothetical protein
MTLRKYADHDKLSPVTLDKSSDTTMHLLFKGYRPVFKRHPLGYEVESLLLLSPQQQMCYHQGNLFGGYAACLLDRILADCCNSTSSDPAFTAYLNTSFRRPVPPKAQVRLRAWPVKIDRRKIYLEGSLDIIGTCGQWIEAISADALFVTPRKEIL